jgi:MFS superfamily sulfate permease-like transporter
MSDLFEIREKVEEGASWRGNIQVNIDGDSKDLTVRQLRDPEFWDVMSDIDTTELENMQDDLPEDAIEEFNELQTADELTDEEEERLEELQEEIEDEESFNLFDTVSESTYEGIQKAAKYGVEPDEQDIQHVLTTKTEEIREKYGGSSRDDARDYVNDHVIGPMIDRSTDFVSFAIGIRVFQATLDDAGN